MLALLYSFIVHVVNPNLKLWSLYEVIYGFFAFTPNVFIPHMVHPFGLGVGLSNFFPGSSLLGWWTRSALLLELPFHCLAFDRACVTTDSRVKVLSFSDNLLSLIPIMILSLASSS